MNYKMKKILIFLICSLPIYIYAQPKEGKAQRVEALRIAFITRKLQLTSEEAKKFWPIYDQFRREMEDLRKKYKDAMAEDETQQGAQTDAEIEKALNDIVAMKQAQLDLTKRYIPEFKKAIPARKILLLFKAEEDFKKELVKRIVQRRQKGNGSSEE
jgi:hypothetical protein